MRLFTFAISSIVDANTGYLAGRKHFVDVDSASRHGREIRSKSVHGLLAGLKNGISSWFEKQRARAQERRELKQLLGMNDRLLRDIGLTRGDLFAVELGTTSLKQIQEQRGRRRGSDHEVVNTAKLGIASDLSGEAANEDSFDDRRCA